MHAVQRLYLHRKSLSTTTFKARGQRVIRCDKCRIAVDYCICTLSPNIKSNAGFLLLMYDTEVLKPSNTGRLIADVIPDTFAFLWSRTEENSELLSVLNDPQWQPFVVFPAQYTEPEREVFKDNLPLQEGKRPLFIMLDGSWREAKKMFRKSPYLNKFPVVAFDPEKVDDEQLASRYQIRNANVENQFATAEVAARMLAMINEPINANVLDLWFDVFSFQYQKSKSRGNKGNPLAIENYIQYIDQQHISKK
ncbi:MAG: DTW domain-containing protein [Colwellia sp.]|nr:DTW domain-containing protein [Colwellia sp.]